MRQPLRPARTTQILEHSFAFAAVVAMAGALAVGFLVPASAAGEVSNGMPFVMLGGCAGIGIWARERLERAHRGEVARVYTAALSGRRDARLERGGDPTRMESLGRAFADLIQTARRATFGRDSLASSMIDGRRTIESSRQRGQTVVASMAEDAHAIANAAQGSREVERSFSASLREVRGKAESAENATAGLADEAETLANSVRAVTLQIERATAIATRMSEAAFATQRSVVGIGESAAAMQEAADQVHDVLQRTEMVGMNAGIEAARAGEAGRSLDEVAAQVKDLTQAGGIALEAMLATIRELKQQSGQMCERIQEISDVVQAQHEFGHALSHAAMLQSDAVGRVLRQISAAQSDVQHLHSQVRDMALPNAARLGVTRAAEQAVERLPGYADAMAQILRGLPDFSTIEKAEKAKEKT
jgi:methyl-accepting chemotaxis protein